MSDTLKNRLRGIYQVGSDGDCFGTRSFADFVPKISLEAANEIERLELLISQLQKGVNQLELISEEVDCAHMWLDDKKVPTYDKKTEAIYSLVGRIERYKTCTIIKL